MSEPEFFACPELQCRCLDVGTLADCERQRCEFAYQRRREEDAIKREAKDQAEKEGMR